MAAGTHFDLKIVFHRRPGLKRVTAAAANLERAVIWVDVVFHDAPDLRCS